MNKSLLKKLISVALSLVLVLSVTTTGMAAAPVNDEMDGMHEMRISTSAGSNGVYTHDMSTGETKFLPTSECVPDDVLDMIPDMEEDEGYSDLEPTMEPRFINNFKEITSPANQYVSTCLVGARFVKEGMEDMTGYGTGWLINNKYVITAGHLLYAKDYKHAHHVAVYVGASGGKYKQYRLGGWTLIGGDYVNNPDGDAYEYKGIYDDWGIIELKSPLTIDVEPLSRRVVNSFSEMNSGTHYINGYPSRLQTTTRWNDWVMYENSGRIEGDLQMRYVPCVWTNMEIPKGMSGGPVYYKSGTKYYADGIGVANRSGQQFSMIVLYSKYINDWVNKKVNKKCG